MPWVRRLRNLFIVLPFCLCGLVGIAAGQQYIISTIAGGVPPPTLVSATSASIGAPAGVATDSAGNVYFASLNCVFKRDQNGILTRIAGNSRPGYSGDGGLATSAQLSNPIGIALDGAGNLFIMDTGNSRIRRVSTTGIITTVAGNGGSGFPVSGAPAVSSSFGLFISSYPNGMAVDAQGNIYIVGTNGTNVVLKISTSGIVSTVAGNGTAGFSGDGALAINAELNNPTSVAVDGSGNLFISDSGNYRIREVTGAGIISTIGGNGTFGYSGDGGPALNAAITPGPLGIDGSGNVFVWDGSSVRKISANGIIASVATIVANGDLAVDGKGNVYISLPAGNVIDEIAVSATITTVAGNGIAFSGIGGPATSAQLFPPSDVAVDSQGNLYIANVAADVLPSALSNRILKISPSGILTTVAGNGTAGFSGDGGPATSAQLWGPSQIAVDATGNLFIADTYNNRIRKVSSAGIITTVAGNGIQGTSGDSGPATSAELYLTDAIAVDGLGNVFIADAYTNHVRRISPDGIITTVAGTGFAGFSGDGGPAISAQLNGIFGLAADAAGDLFIADGYNHRIREVSTNGIISTIAGNGTEGFSGDGGLATAAQLSFPVDVAVDSSGNVYFGDNEGYGSNRVRKISAGGVITTIAGNGLTGYSGDGGPAATASFSSSGLAVSQSGNIYIADPNGLAIRLLTPSNQAVLVSAVVDAASESVGPVSPGKIVAIYGGGLGPQQLALNQPDNGVFGTQLAGTSVAFNGISAPLVYTSATQVAAIVPYAVSGTSAQMTVSYQGQVSSAFAVTVAASAPGLFTVNETGAGQLATVNAVTGVFNDAAHPAKAGDYLELFATGEGQTTPAGVDGKTAALPYPAPLLAVSVTVGGISAPVVYAGGAPGETAGLMQVNIQIPPGVAPGGYVPVVLTVGAASTINGAVSIAVSAN